MHLKSFIFLFSLISIIAVSCGPKGALNINGNVTDASNLNIYFDKITATNSARVISNTQADANGKFNLSFENKLVPGIYRIRVGAKGAYLMIDDTDKNISISGNIASLANNTFEVTGSESSKLLQESMITVGNARNSGINLDEYILKGRNPIINTFIAEKAYQLSIGKIDLFTSLESQLKEEYPTNEYTEELSGLVAEMKKQLEANNKTKSKFDVGDVAPDIVGLDPNGKERKLSDLKGKVVLVDFWASWCGPCRKANPHVVEVYDKYKNQGFDVFSFSLDGINPRQLAAYNNDQEKINMAKDQAKERWKAAIEQDNLKWKNHASELAHWNSKANKEYGVSSIPTTFLIARDGTIAAVNPRYNLEEAVKAAL